MKGDNPIRKPLADHDGQSLALKSIFPTLQGEGLYAGVPSVFVRLGGCNLACGFCDTEFEDFADIALSDLVEQIKTLSCNAQGLRVRHLVVITGGEPFRQNIAPLCAQLIADGFKIQVETNGTLWREVPPEVDIVCSPKNTGQGYFPIREDLLARVSAFKFIISKHDPLYGQVADVGQSRYNTPVYVQPMDEHDEARNRDNTAYALALATQHGYRLSLQLHKLLDIE
ncbi:MAG: 7-carboxy-7-deazaguanine synthase QueE [Rickettsiales bacterium]|nr:7-carboxy-7-deazaguanine synthase QueE [Rickettsiales bacterium]